jgi:hypothetical protein
LTKVSPEVARSLFKATKVEYLEVDKDMLGRIRSSRHGREMWRYLALAVCLLLMTESVLSHQIDRV